MKGLLFALAGLVVGSALGGFLALGFGSGVGAVSGLIYGAQVGICVAAEGARERGALADPAALDAVIAGAVERIRSRIVAAPGQAEGDWISDAAACKALV
jgi:hypothetical protein